MSITIACLEIRKANPRMFIAHTIDEKLNHYKCGVCLMGNIRLSILKKLIYNRCGICNAKLSIQNTEDIDL